MPFPLAHPAAILPLCRFTRLFCAPALIIGSIVPDASYLVPGGRISDVAHQWKGVLLFSLPAGFLIWMLWELAWSWLRPTCPEITTSPPQARGAAVRIRVILLALLSIVIGAATHVFWDSFTHKGAWAVQHLDFLQMTVAHYGHRHLRVHHLLWYASSFVGAAWVGYALLAWRTKCAGPPPKPKRLLIAGLVFGTLILPVAAVHHILPGVVGQALTALLVAALLAGVWILSGAKTAQE